MIYRHRHLRLGGTEKEHRRTGSLHERTFRYEARIPRPVAQRGRVPNTEHQQANAPALSGHVRVALYPNRA